MPSPPSRRVLRGLLISAVALCASLALLELGFRLVEARLGVQPNRLAALRSFVCDGRVEFFVPRAHTVFGRLPGGAINSDGFSDVEWRRERTPGKLRIACLGGSTTEGGNPSGRVGSYPFLLGELLRRHGHAEVEVMNCGISGWTSAEITAAWFLTLRDFQPDLVIYHEAVNDTEPRNWPRFEVDYSHWRQPWTVRPAPAWTRWTIGASDLAAWWALEHRALPNITKVSVAEAVGGYAFRDGHFPPGTEEPYRRNLSSIARSQHARGAEVLFATLPPKPPPADGSSEASWGQFRQAIREHNAIMRELAREPGNSLVDLEALAASVPETMRPHYIDLVHMDAEGNLLKATAIANQLETRWIPAWLARAQAR